MNRSINPSRNLLGISFIGATVLCCLLGVSCESKKSKKVSFQQASPSGSETTTTGDDPTNAGVTPLNVDAIAAGSVTTPELYTVDAVQNTCSTFTFVVTGAGQPIADVDVTFTVSESTEAKNPGKVDPATVKSDASGIATGTYCSDKDEAKVVIVGAVGTLSANSGEITVTQKPVYSFKYARTDLAGSKPEDTSIQLNVMDSGPSDCTTVYFVVMKGDQPAMNKNGHFVTQPDYPKGSKLAKKADSGTFATDTVTSKKYAAFDAVSNTAGELAVPVCAGTVLGSIQLSGTFTDEFDKVYSAKSPLINITAGLTYWSNLSLTFDKTNAKTLTGYFNTNSDKIQDFWVKAGARQDGLPITDYPIYISAETGRVVVDGNGFPSATDGTVKFSMQALHMGNYRPYPVYTFSNADAQTRCDPIGLAASGGIAYKNLAKNWRSTLVYAVRGQEPYYDANHNGVYDGGGHGFWDKNLNGIFDGDDVVTYDPDNDGAFNYTGEWFIDMPTPFIDVDENGIYEANKDILLGDEYLPPNGKRDADTMIWKHEYIPIYMGASAFSVTNGAVRNGTLAPDVTSPEATAYYTHLNALGVRSGDPSKLFQTYQRTLSYNEDDLFYDENNSGHIDDLEASVEGWARFHLYAHGVCGNLMPGGTTLAIGFEDLANVAYGNRLFTGHFYIQSEDTVREPSRHMLASADGSSKATINFNASDHPSREYGYPIEFVIKVAPCKTSCTGAVTAADPGVACDARNVQVTVTTDSVNTPANFSVPAVNLCHCVATAAGVVSGECVCPTGKTFSNGACS